MGILQSLFGQQQPQVQPGTQQAQPAAVDTETNPGHGLLFGTYKTPEQEMAQLALFSQLASGRTPQDQLNFGPTLIPFQQAMAQKQAAIDVKNKTVAVLQQKYPDLAAYVQAGSISPPEATMEMFKRDQEAKTANKPEFHQFDDGSYGWVTPGSKDIQIVGKTAGKSNLINLGKGLLYDPATKQYITPPANATADQQTEYGVTPVWFKDKDGNMRLGLPGKNGSMKILDNPDGLTPLPGVTNVDTGTSILQQNKKTGETVGQVPKDIAGKAQQEALGKTQATIQAQLATTHQTADQVQNAVKDLINDPDLGNALGPINSRLPTLWPSTARVEAKINQIKGQVFLQARQLLKGGGAITDFEGQKGEDAYARLNNAQNPEDFIKALTDFNSAVQDGVKKLDAQAGGNWNPVQTQPDASNIQPVTALNPKTGERIMLQNGQWVPMK